MKSRMSLNLGHVRSESWFLVQIREKPEATLVAHSSLDLVIVFILLKSRMGLNLGLVGPKKEGS